MGDGWDKIPRSRKGQNNSKRGYLGGSLRGSGRAKGSTGMTAWGGGEMLMLRKKK